MSSKMTSRSVEDFFDTEYRAYAFYTIENRAIPSVIDGFKPAQRKIAFAANRLWKTGNEKPMKVFQLGGQAAAMSFFHHGSLDGTIIGMTQTFKNSMPIFDGIGQFGSLRSPEAGAPRYVGVRFSESFRLLYKDFDLVTPQFEEGEEIEPKFFLPIVPTVLLNGGSGIAVGFATNILNRNPLDLVNACINLIESGKIGVILRPWINGFHGPITGLPGTDKTWIFNGRFEVKNTTTVDITEIPPSFTYEKYEALLENLTDKGTVVSYEDSSSDRVSYRLKFSRQVLADLIKKDRLGDVLKMREQETENLTVLDENGKLKVFSNAEDIVKYFVNVRLQFYVMRKARLISDLDSEIALLDSRARFIKAVIDGEIKLNNVPKVQVIASILQVGIPTRDGSHDHLLTMPIHSLTTEKYADLLSKLGECVAQKAKVEATTPEQFYLTDLKDLRKKLRPLFPSSPA